MKFVFILLALALTRGILLYKTYHSIPLVELKRRARQGDKGASALYKVAVYDKLLDLRQFVFCTTVGTVLLIWAARTNWWLGTITAVVISWLVVWPKASAEGRAGGLAALFVPFDVRIMTIIKPLLDPFARLLFRRGSVSHTRLYEKKDLLETLNKQTKQPDNRIAPDDLKIVLNGLEFGDKTVGSIMTPRKEIKMVKADDSIGPMLMDELHKSGFSRFPVVKDISRNVAPEVVGTLYINNLIGYEGGGKVKDLARKEVYYINEDSNLRQALAAFLKTHHHLLIVVNSFEEMVGLLTLEDVLGQILGTQVLDDFEGYDDVRTVAKADSKQEDKNHNENQVAAEPK